MKLRRDQTKCLQGIAILFMLGLHLFNRIDISNFYECKNIPWGGTSLNTHFVTYLTHVFRFICFVVDMVFISVKRLEVT